MKEGRKEGRNKENKILRTMKKLMKQSIERIEKGINYLLKENEWAAKF